MHIMLKTKQSLFDQSLSTFSHNNQAVFRWSCVSVCMLLMLLIISPFSYLYKNEIQSIDRQAFKGLVSLEQL